MSRPGVLVTRAEPGCGETAARLAEMGYRPLASPALGLEPVDPPPPLPAGPLAGLVFTSANGVRAYAERAGDRSPRAWCVGPATLEAARKAGFGDAVSAEGAGDDLADLIIETANPTAGPLLHVANAAAGGQLAARLRQAGFTAHFAGLYHPVPATGFTREAETALRLGGVAAVLFHSAKGAEAFAPLAAGHDLTGTAAVAVSEKALDPVRRLDWQATASAARPNETALLAALAAALAPV